MDINLDELNKALFSALVADVTLEMVNKTFENLCLDYCPEDVFSTYVFGLIDKWFETHGKDKEGIKKFLDTVKRVGTETYEDEKRRKNV